MNPVILLITVVIAILFPELRDACGFLVHLAVIYLVVEFLLTGWGKNARR